MLTDDQWPIAPESPSPPPPRRRLTTRPAAIDFPPQTQTSQPTTDDFDHLPAVLTTREAANALRIGVKELRKLVDTGHIPAARLGPRRLIRISRAALVATLSARGG